MMTPRALQLFQSILPLSIITHQKTNLPFLKNQKGTNLWRKKHTQKKFKNQILITILRAVNIFSSRRYNIKKSLFAIILKTKDRNHRNIVMLLKVKLIKFDIPA